jgi:DNA-binding NarL/FixJ family response regulator
MVGRRRQEGPLDELTPREREVLVQLAEGKSNKGIAETLVVTTAAVEKHVTSIFQKLDLDNDPHRAPVGPGRTDVPAGRIRLRPLRRIRCDAVS